RQSGPPRLRHGVALDPRAAPAPDRLRTGADASGLDGRCPAMERAVPSVAGNADGLRSGHMFQLRDPGADAPGLGLSPGMRRRADFRRELPGVGMKPNRAQAVDT